MMGFPELTDSFLAGQNIFYQQFNEVEFYVEDTGKEHFYFNIFRKLFPEIQFEKIFPLNGKENVVNEAKLTFNDKKKVFIVDLDFDNFLNIKENIDNLFYLEKYSIENYLIEKGAIYEIIREKNSNLKDHNIDLLIDYNTLITNCANLLFELVSAFITIQKFQLGKEYYNINCARDFNFGTVNYSYKGNNILNYLSEVEGLLKAKDKRFSLNANFKRHKRELKICNIPGKYLLNIIKHQLDGHKIIHQVPVESLAYKLSKETDFSNLHFLRDKINEFRA